MKTNKTIEMPVYSVNDVEYIKVYHVMTRHKGQKQAGVYLSYIDEDIANEVAESNRKYGDVEACYVTVDAIFIR